MKLMKRKTRKAIRKSIRKAVGKHGPEIAGHLATAAMAGLTALLAAEPKKGKKKLKKLGDNLRHAPQAIAARFAGGDEEDTETGCPKQKADD